MLVAPSDHLLVYILAARCLSGIEVCVRVLDLSFLVVPLALCLFLATCVRGGTAWTCGRFCTFLSGLVIVLVLGCCIAYCTAYSSNRPLETRASPPRSAAIRRLPPLF